MNSKTILTNAFKLLVLTVCISVVTYAWFARGENSTMKSIDAYVESVTELNVSTDGGTTWSEDGLTEITDGLIFEHEVTGNGLQLYVPALKNNLGVPNYFTLATQNEDYLDIDLTFKSDEGVLIFLESASQVMPAAGTNESFLCCTNTVINQSADGNFSKDIIAGAVRIAFIETDENDVETVKMVWAPNKNYELAYSNGAYTAILNSTNIQDYRYLNILTSTTYDYQSIQNLYDTITVNKNEKKSHGEPYLTVIGESGLSEIKARVWIEGNDRETVATLKGGKFKLKFSFLALKKAISSAPDVSISGSGILGADTSMEYSIDDGQNWTNYTEDSTFNEGTTVLIRVKETSTVIESPIVRLNF